MMIGNLNSAIAARTPVAASSVSDVSGTGRANAPPPPPEEDGSSRVSISKGTELVQQLSDLQKADPAKFKLVVDEISQKFGQLAASKTGAEADGLSRLSEAFKKTADTGDLTSIAVEGNRGHGTPDVQREGGQNARVAEMYRKNGPPAAPPQAREDAFAQALSVVGTATGAERASASSSATNSRTTALGGIRAA
ncbi:MAG TPA: hypothetical protein VFG30_38960 [Polyangiales bacterium]|nr:hypothetical protein [Polyangiales bacterium]